VVAALGFVAAALVVGVTDLRVSSRRSSRTGGNPGPGAV
jgi:hypothetical protein